MRLWYKDRVVQSILIYTLIRVISLFTWGHPEINSLITLPLVVIFGFISLKNLPLAWVILITELILNGSGHFFELGGLIIRTWFLAIFALAWVIKKIKQKNWSIDLPKNLTLSLSIYGFFLGLAIIRGFLLDHSPILVLQDTILYLFLLLTLPALEFKKINNYFLPILAQGFIIGSAIFSGITLLIYSSGLGNLPDWYYHWFRNVAAGKITDLGYHFFRIVLPEHLLIVPAIIILASLLMTSFKSKKLWGLMACALFVLVLNFSRIYFLALVPGFLFLAYKQPLKQWFRVSLIVVLGMTAIFALTHLIASRGASVGLELVGLRATGITAPNDEVSGAIRMALLPNILEIIKSRPWFGSGLATMVSFIHPVTLDVQFRTQFDWGYFEQLAELGILGTLAFIICLCLILYHLTRRTYTVKILSEEKQLKHGLIAGALSLFVINLTTPALFQGFGILYFVYLMTYLSPNHASEKSNSSPLRNA